MSKCSFFVTAKSDKDPDPDKLGSLDPDPCNIGLFLLLSFRIMCQNGKFFHVFLPHFQRKIIKSISALFVGEVPSQILELTQLILLG
jgi:hypothetical protein